MPSPIVLASASTARAELLQRARVNFEVVTARVDERAADPLAKSMAPREFATHLATLKATEVGARMPTRWVLGADQLALTEDSPPVFLHKPGTPQRALAQLMRLRGRTHQLVTAAVLRAPSGELHSVVDVHRMHMREFDEAEARAYVKQAQPLWSVGAYHIEDAGIRLFERVEGGDFNAIMGLPLLGCLAMLRRTGQLHPLAD